MPYRLKGAAVQVKRRGRWQVLKRHKSIAAARKHLSALAINVMRKGHK